MIGEFISRLAIKSRQDLTIARHLFVFRKRGEIIENLIIQFNDLNKEDRETISNQYVL
jgi:hypothetical protein